MEEEIEICPVDSFFMKTEAKLPTFSTNKRNKFKFVLDRNNSKPIEPSFRSMKEFQEEFISKSK